jgi:hypothetical protein
MEQTSLFNVLIVIYSLIVISTIFMGCGENRKVVVFKDYDDLGLSMLLPLSTGGLIILFSYFGLESWVGLTVGGITGLVLLCLLGIKTFHNNQGNVFKTLLALNTKIPLSVIWVFSLFQTLNPSGRTAQERRSNRGFGLIMLTVITPILGLLVVEKEGSLFNPKQWIKGRRVGAAVRSNL